MNSLLDMLTRRKLSFITFIPVIALVILVLLLTAMAPQSVQIFSRTILGLIFVLFLPGYTLQAAVFPRRTDLDTPERWALSFGLSLALIALIALLLDKLSWGIRFWPILVCEIGFILLFSLAAVFRRRLLPIGERQYTSTLGDIRLWFATSKRHERQLYMFLAGTILIAVLSAAAILFWPSPAKYYTEFYILGAHGLAEEYPRVSKPGEALTVIVGITNHERSTKNYRVEAIASSPVSLEKQRVAQLGPFPLQPGDVLEIPVHWQMPEAGQDQSVDFLLIDSQSGDPYRRLRLIIDVLPDV